MKQGVHSAIEVNLGHLEHNLQALKCYLNKETGIMAVVKADAYGHGAVKAAQKLEPLVEAFAVNDVDEGIELRDEDITKPILVFEVPHEGINEKYRMHNLIATISKKEDFALLPSGTSYHLNFDTGMGRLGFHPDEAQEIRELVDDNRQMFLTGLYSHFATAAEPGSAFVNKQIEVFKNIRSYFPEHINVHIANTGATLFYEQEQFNMVRLGIGMYGYPPGDTKVEELKSVLSWKSKLAEVSSIKANHSVSYGAHWHAPSEGYLGVIPVGYADGLKRNLSDRLSVKIDDKLYDLVGTITMNYCMVFLEDTPFEAGQEVELLFPESNAKTWADAIGTIPYEILTSIKQDIERTYYDRGL